MGQNNFFRNGAAWFQNLPNPTTEAGQRFQGTLIRNFAFSFAALALEIPLGIAVRRTRHLSPPSLREAGRQTPSRRPPPRTTGRVPCPSPTGSRLLSANWRASRSS